MSTVKEITKLGALNLRQETTKLEEFELVKLVNFDISRKPGTLSLRRGSEVQYSIASQDVVRQVAKVNGTRYQVANQNLYRAGTAIMGDLSTENETNFQAYRPLDDTAIWAFVADDNIMVKDDGSRLYLWGLDLIPLPAPQLCNQTAKDPADTIVAGTYGIAVTQVRWDETQSGPTFQAP